MIAIQSRINHSPINSQSAKVVKKQSTNGTSFQQVFQNELSSQSSIKVSKHASMRLASRGIEITSDELKRIDEAVTEANKKGIKDSLVIMKDVALVVNIKNKTIVTAVKNEDEQQIFSKIDGAILL